MFDLSFFSMLAVISVFDQWSFINGWNNVFNAGFSPDYIRTANTAILRRIPADFQWKNSPPKNQVKQNLTFYEGTWKQITVNRLSTRLSPTDMCSKEEYGFSRPSTTGAGKAWKDYPFDELLICLPQTFSCVGWRAACQIDSCQSGADWWGKDCLFQRASSPDVSFL